MDLSYKKRLVDYYLAVRQSYNIVEKYVKKFNFSNKIESDIKVTISNTDKEIPLYFTSEFTLDNGTKIKQQSSEFDDLKLVEFEFEMNDRKLNLMLSPNMIALGEVEFLEPLQQYSTQELISLSTIATCFRPEEIGKKRLDINTFPDNELNLTKVQAMVYYNTKLNPTVKDDIKCYLGNTLISCETFDVDSLLSILDNIQNILQQSFNFAISILLDNKTEVLDELNIFPGLEFNSYLLDEIEMKDVVALPIKNKR